VLGPLALSLALTVPCQAQQGTAVDEGKAVLDKAIAAFNARDYATYETLFTDDIEVYTGVYTPLRFIGKTQWFAFIHGLDNYAAVNYDQRQASCRAYNNDTVLCNAYFVFSTTTKTGVSEVQTGRESSTMVRVGGRWLIANHHFSANF
jgi:ketosteroid isomerase-like protein